MREIKLGAIQPVSPPPVEACDCLSDRYAADLDLIYQCGLSRAEVSFELLRRAGEMGLDAVTTSEDLFGVSHYLMDNSPTDIFTAFAEKSGREAEDRLSELAAKHHMNIVGCYMKKVGANVYNAAVLFDRKGRIVGEYHKTHLPPNELWRITPGDSIDVFETDIGMVGVEICYDMMFPAVSDILSVKGAEVVFHPTAGYGWYDSIGEATLRTRANDGSFYLVTAKNHCHNAAGHSSVIDYWGQVLSDAGFYPNAVTAATVDLDRPKTQPDWFYPTGMTGEANVRARTFTERRPDLYADCVAGGGQRAPTPEQRAVMREKVRKGIVHW